MNLADVGHIKKSITHKPDWIKSPQAIFSFLSHLLLLPSPSPQKTIAGFTVREGLCGRPVTVC